MNALFDIQLINLLGFAVGAVLYALLLAMTLKHRVREQNKTRVDFLLFATAVLGLVWNAGEFVALIGRDFGFLQNSPILFALSHSALGFLPAVIVHLTLNAAEDEKNFAAKALSLIAYSLSALAAFLHFQAALFQHVAPSNLALQILTFGYLTVLATLVLFAFRQTITRKAVLAAALAVFAVSALHLSLPHDESKSWLIEFIGHQSSLPLALAILYGDFRFAFADLFLKRALALLLLTLAVLGLYVLVAAPLLEMHKNHGAEDSQPVFILLGLWILTALIYPALHKFAVWLVDKVLLRRVNYEVLRKDLANKITRIETADEVLDEIAQTLSLALTANAANWSADFEQNDKAVDFSSDKAIIRIETTEPPFYQIVLQNFAGGRRLLSGEIEMLENAAVLAARRIDALRVSHERCEQEIREQEIGKLVSEAELRALRAQLNPHFLFNALTTIGYLIQSAPDKALDTLLRLTQLLRGVLRASGEFSSLGEELKLIESYLEIERARFEERLEVEIKVAPELLKLSVPSLILQPLVENAVKHGIAPKKNGGRVSITAKIENQNLILEVFDTGAGVDEFELIEKRRRGVGLNNIENRLRSYFGDKAELKIESRARQGTTARIVLPLQNEFKVQSSKQLEPPISFEL